MPEFLERLSQFAGDAEAVRESFMSGETGMRRFTFGDPRIAARSLALLEMVRDVRSGKRPEWHLREAMTTSDFPLLFGDNLYRILLGQYQTYPITYPQYTKIIEVKDFRANKMFTLDGGTGVLPKVGERGEYPETKFIEGVTPIQVFKYGEKISMSFEMMVNDDLNAFQDRIQPLADGARMGEEKLATSLFMGANGPDTTLFTTGRGNIVPNNPPLSIPGLQAAFTALAAMKNPDGQPIVITGVQLVVAPANAITARNILNATELRINGDMGGGTTNTQLITQNWMKAQVGLSINPFIPIIGSAANGNSSWFLFANPQGNNRPAIVMAFLQGRRKPQMFMKDPNQRMIGGGPADPMEGDFETDSIDYKIRQFMGGTQLDYRAVVASNGSGS